MVRPLAAALTACALLTTACTASNSGSPDLVGTWVGDYSFPLADGTSNTSTETLVVSKQDGVLLWGYEEWEENGTWMRADLTGTITSDNGIVLTEPAGFYRGTVEGDTMTVTFTRIDPEQHTAFEVTLTRQ